MIDKKFIINLQGNEFVKFEGLLAEFHNNKGKSIETEELSTSTPDEPKFKAVVSGDRETFTGHGDANANNVNRLIANHKYRMAETRAIARALRWYNNIGMCSIDEIGGDEKKIPAYSKEPVKQNPVVASTVKNNATQADSSPVCCECGKPIDNVVKSFSEGKYGFPLCRDCQKIAK